MKLLKYLSLGEDKISKVISKRLKIQIHISISTKATIFLTQSVKTFKVSKPSNKNSKLLKRFLPKTKF